MATIVTSQTECPIFHMIISRYGIRKCVPGFVYIAQSGDLFKIGSTTKVSHNCISDRLPSLQRRTGLKFTFIEGIFSNCAKGLERTLHVAFAEQHVNIEFVTKLKVFELFKLSPANLEAIQAIVGFNGKPVAHIADPKLVVDYLDWNTQPIE